ncbi:MULTISPECIES: glucose-6-phosphate isomerase [Sphingomonas]|uniref:Glucose-6-phosphate isomerase n=1 Tax=Edaphosphingomonas fennica TaxID=114404 RepID=A0A2T4HUE8_9SPHN|nr:MULTISPECIES: glucose-6-phosphate isomerase [Sphingomonas]AGH47975.1 glucose-6-phosphate isomerase [Sphingomonas sp. MM-1]MDX3882774.1 glucose-6-phosphate isomerase [Sphingomonas sp.]PTD19415.1 glucose-6-phosphate isomerase [Sphingomonas fennica]
MVDTVKAWQAIQEAARPSLTELFQAEPDRLSRLTIDEGGLHFDFSKTHLDAGLIDRFVALADAAGFAKAREALFSGAAVNVTEGRAAEHPAERGQGAPESVARARHFHARMRALIDAIEADALGPIRHVLHIGIGGSALGPDLLVDALGRDSGRYDVAIVSNVDGAALEAVFRRFDPAATLVVIASKTFTTTETMLNAASALAWLAEAGVEDPYGQVVALTAAPERAVEWGVDETRVLPFAESVGGRYSLWSSIGFPAALALGWDAFETLLEGAAAMDRHFRLAPPERNAPLLAAFVDLYYAAVRQAETRAVFAYDERLRLLPSYLQQLEMESNGKRVRADGKPVDHPTAPITWGGVGTDAQHAVFQLLHQGTHLVPVEFIASIEPGDALDEAHHRALLTNAFAQGAALMAGKASEDPARAYPGDRPSTTILLDSVDPARLGALIAFYEHRVFANAALLGINPFDQFGVELGKEIAKSIETEGTDRFDPSTRALIARAFG